MACSSVSDIKMIDRHSDVITSFTSNTTLTNAIAIAVDQSNGFVFFTDVNSKEIWRNSFKTQAPSEIIYSLETGEDVTADSCLTRRL